MNDNFEIYLQDKLEDFYEIGLKEVASIVDEEIAHDFGMVLAWAYKECDDSATNIVRKFNIDEKHLAGLLNDKEWLKDIYIEANTRYYE